MESRQCFVRRITSKATQRPSASRRMKSSRCNEAISKILQLQLIQSLGLSIFTSLFCLINSILLLIPTYSMSIKLFSNKESITVQVDLLVLLLSTLRNYLVIEQILHLTSKWYEVILSTIKQCILPFFLKNYVLKTEYFYTTYLTKYYMEPFVLISK